MEEEDEMGGYKTIYTLSGGLSGFIDLRLRLAGGFSPTAAEGVDESL